MSAVGVRTGKKVGENREFERYRERTRTGNRDEI